jgi:hypothetical protein
MKTACEILSEVKSVLLSLEFMERHKIRAEDFSRKPILTFTILIIFILNGIKKSTQVQLDAFVEVVLTGNITKSAFSDARKKINPSAFIELNNVLISEYYTNNRFKTYLGFIVFGIDGTTLQLPNSLEITDKYGFATNGKKDHKGMPMGRASNVYDVLNGITISTYLEPYNTSERNIYFKHIKDIGNFKQKNSIEKVLVILDRGYPSIGALIAAISSGIDVVARCRSDFLKETFARMIKNNQKDMIFKCSDLWPKPKWKQRRELERNSLDFKTLENKFIRILVIDLPTGEKEFLITTLFDQQIYEYDLFAELYFSRWGIEENYKFMKVRVEVENWSGFTTHAINQDFHSSIFSLNAHQVILNQAQVEIKKEEYNRRIIKTIVEEQKKKTKKYDYKINKNVSTGAFKDKIIYALLDPEADLDALCMEVILQSKNSLVPIRPGRANPRIVKNTHRKYHMNRRRCT